MSESPTPNEADQRILAAIDQDLIDILSQTGASIEFRNLYRELGDTDEYYQAVSESVIQQLRVLPHPEKLTVSAIERSFDAGVKGHRSIPEMSAMMSDGRGEDELKESVRNASAQLSRFKQYFRSHYLQGKTDRFFSDEDLDR